MIVVFKPAGTFNSQQAYKHWSHVVKFYKISTMDKTLLVIGQVSSIG